MKEQIIECEKRLLQAMITGDLIVLDEFLHDDLVFIIPTGQTITKDMDLENYRSGVLKVTGITATDQVIQSIENTFIVSVTLQLKATYAEQVVDGKFRYLRVWKNVGSEWKVIAGSGIQIEERR